MPKAAGMVLSRKRSNGLMRMRENVAVKFRKRTVIRDHSCEKYTSRPCDTYVIEMSEGGRANFLNYDDRTEQNFQPSRKTHKIGIVIPYNFSVFKMKSLGAPTHSQYRSITFLYFYRLFVLGKPRALKAGRVAPRAAERAVRIAELVGNDLRPADGLPVAFVRVAVVTEAGLVFTYDVSQRSLGELTYSARRSFFLAQRINNRRANSSHPLRKHFRIFGLQNVLITA